MGHVSLFSHCIDKYGEVGFDCSNNLSCFTILWSDIDAKAFAAFLARSSDVQEYLL